MPFPLAFAAVWAFLVGATVGSFLNVCIYRLPRNESVVFPASHCPWCNTRLRPADLIPVVSQFLLKSRCRYCGQWFSWRYLFVEVLTGACFSGLVLRFGVGWELLPLAVLAAVLLATVFTDLDSWLIPDELTLGAALAGVAHNVALLPGYPLADLQRSLGEVQQSLGELGLPFLCRGSGPYFLVGVNVWADSDFVALLPQSVAGMLFAGAAILGVGWLGAKVFRKESMGGGDVKLAAAVGAHFGLRAELLTFFLIAVTLGSVVGIILLTAKRRRGTDYLPFGPMLSAGAFGALFLGHWLTPVLTRLYDPSALWLLMGK